MNRTHRSSRAAAGLMLSAATVTVTGTVIAGTPAVAVAAPTAPTAPAVLPQSLSAYGPMVIAHRGDRLHAPENTVSAFRGAIAQGADAIELDVQFSRSGYPVVFHDWGLRRTSDCRGRVDSKTVRQLHKCDAGSWFGHEFDGEQIPTLWEALKEIRKKSSTAQVILHLRAEPTRREARKTMQRVRLNHMSDRVIVMASTPAAMTRLRHAGAKKQAYIFTNSAGWNHKYKIMVPYDLPLNTDEIAAARQRGAAVWTVESHPLKIEDVLGLAEPVQGVMLNNLSRERVGLLDGLLGTVVAPLLKTN